MARPPLPPFDTASAAQKVRLAEDAWNTRNPEQVALAYGIETISFGPQNLVQVGMWVWVYGLMAYLPACTVPGRKRFETFAVTGVRLINDEFTLMLMPQRNSTVPATFRLWRGRYSP